MTAAPSAAALEQFGCPPFWSRTVDVSSHDGAVHRWHLLDRPGTDPASPTVLCLHGNPTWSFVWSRLLRELDPALRVIAPDHLSMGWSERVGPRRYADRVADVNDLLRALDLQGPVWIVAQDWGGAIAMGVAVEHPELVVGLVLSNTGIAVPEGRRAPWLIRLAAANGVHRFATRDTSLFVRGTALLSGRRLNRIQRRALALPYRTRVSRQAVAEFVGDVPFDDRHPSAAALASVASRLGSLDIPVRLVWGARDPVFNDDFAEDLLGRFRDVALHRLGGAGHLAVLEMSIAPYVEAAITAGQAADVGIRVEQAGGATQRSDAAAPYRPLWSEVVANASLNTPAVSDAAADESVTWSAFAGRVARFATAMSASGVRAGDRVAVLVPPGVDLLATVYACWRIGAVTVVADRGLGLNGLGAAVRSARVRHVVGPAKSIAAARVLRWAPGAQMLSLRSLGANGASADIAGLALPEPQPADPAAVVFTSGATGPAKGVRYTHGQLCAQRDALRRMYGITPADRFVAAFAPFAVFGPALGMVTGLADMDVTAPATLTASALDEACARIGATMVFASPAALANVVRTATGSLPALGAIRLVMSAGAPVPIETLRSMRGLCPGAALHTPYGMTEVLPVADVALAELELIGPGRGVCVGAPVDGCEVMVETTGEVLVHAPWMSDGYDRLWHTQQRARPLVRAGGTERVWHRTGDVGHLDEHGRLWIEGRVQHVITTPDGPVTPVPLEISAETITGVVRAAAVGIGPVGVQQVVLVLETAEGAEGPAPTSLAAAVRAAVGPQAVAAVWVSKHLPVDIRHNAKIDRTALGLTMERILSGSSR